MFFIRNPQVFSPQVIRMFTNNQARVSSRSSCRIYSLPAVHENRSFAQVREPVSRRHLGRVLFEGNLWRAHCLSSCVFDSGETVQVLYRQGNTLIVGHVFSQ